VLHVESIVIEVGAVMNMMNNNVIPLITGGGRYRWSIGGDLYSVNSIRLVGTSELLSSGSITISGESAALQLGYGADNGTLEWACGGRINVDNFMLTNGIIRLRQSDTQIVNFDTNIVNLNVSKLSWYTSKDYLTPIITYDSETTLANEVTFIISNTTKITVYGDEHPTIDVTRPQPSFIDINVTNYGSITIDANSYGVPSRLFAQLQFYSIQSPSEFLNYGTITLASNTADPSSIAGFTSSYHDDSLISPRFINYKLITCTFASACVFGIAVFGDDMNATSLELYNSYDYDYSNAVTRNGAVVAGLSSHFVVGSVHTSMEGSITIRGQSEMIVFGTWSMRSTMNTDATIITTTAITPGQFSLRNITAMNHTLASLWSNHNSISPVIEWYCSTGSAWQFSGPNVFLAGKTSSLSSLLLHLNSSLHRKLMYDCSFHRWCDMGSTKWM
jgi:hypothetical protein